MYEVMAAPKPEAKCYVRKFEPITVGIFSSTYCITLTNIHKQSTA